MGRKFRRGSAARRLTTWFQFSPVATVQSSETGVNIIQSLNAAALALRPFTIVRSHFLVTLRSDQSAAIEVQVAAMGIAVVSDQAVAVGVTAVPTPITEAASSLWLLHQHIAADESNITDRTRSGQFVFVDSKAMRKVEVGQDIVLVTEGGGTGSGFVITTMGRMLVKNN